MNNDNITDISLYDLLQGIHEGTYDAKNLTKGQRQALVQVLLLRGQEHMSIAKLLKVTDRTIRRDISEIWEQNSLGRDPEYTKKFVGQVHLRAMSFVDSLTRMGYSKDASNNDKRLAFLAAWRSLKELFEKLQTLGYLPTDKRTNIPPAEDNKPKVVIKKKETEDDKVMKQIEELHPQERERIRNDLVKEIIRLSQAEPETQPKKDNGDDPEAGSADLAT